MKLIHLADLHIGKRVNGFSMLEDQKYIMEQICGILDEVKPDAVLLAGDIYDKPIPSEEAVELFDRFLVQMRQRCPSIIVIHGNHDSAERLAFGNSLMTAAGVRFAPVYNGTIEPVSLQDEYGTVQVWPIPFLKPAYVRRYNPDAGIESYEDAMRTVVGQLPMDPAVRNVALVHQFIAGSTVCRLEEESIGGLDQISASVFDAFDYVALGHLHGPQSVGRSTVRYSGSPLKYSFSEASHKKSVTVVELGEKGKVELKEYPLTPMREMRRMYGAFEDVIRSGMSRDDYYEVTLTDEEDVPDALNRLRERFPNIMHLKYDYTRTEWEREQDEVCMEERSELELFAELFARQKGRPMDSNECRYMETLIRDIRGE